MTDSGEVRSTSIHHLAFTTRDVEATYDFYANKLGMALIHCETHRHGDGWFRHFFFDVGGGEAIGFFELEDVGEDPDYKTEISTGLGLPPWANHVAFRLDSLEELQVMTDQAHERGVENIMQIDHGWCTSIYIADPNGITVEFCVTTDEEEFIQTGDEALRLLRLAPEDFLEEDRREGSAELV